MQNLFNNRLNYVKDWKQFFSTLWKRKGIFYLPFLIFTLFIFYYAIDKSDSLSDEYPIQILCFLASFVWVLFVSWNMIPGFTQIKFIKMGMHPAWLFVILAAVLRYAAHFIFPPANQTAFEELQMGDMAYNMLLTHDLSIMWRFTRLLAQLGFSTGNGIDLDSLRNPFQMVGIISIFLLALSLRQLKINWYATLLVTFIAATMRLLVIASSVAYNLFSVIFLVIALVLCLIQFENTEKNQTFWASIAGIIGGILMFENTAFRPYIVLGLGWFIWRCMFCNPSRLKISISSRWFNLFSFGLPLTLVSLPTIIQTFKNPAGSVFLEAFFRYKAERPSLFAPEALTNIQSGFMSLTGWPTIASGYIAIPGEPLIMPLVGWLFTISLIFSLFFTSRGLMRAIGLTIIFDVVSAGMFANNADVTRMIPVVPMFLILTGDFLDWVYCKITRWNNKNTQGFGKITLSISSPSKTDKSESNSGNDINIEPNNSQPAPSLSNQIVIDFNKIKQVGINTIVVVCFCISILWVTVENFKSITRMAADPQVILEYANDQYAICSYIGKVIHPGQRVFLYAMDGTDQCMSDATSGWYFGGNLPEVHRITGPFITPDALNPGDLVVVSFRNQMLTDVQLSQLVDLGNNLDSLTSLQFNKNIAGKITAASICVKCDGSTSDITRNLSQVNQPKLAGTPWDAAGNIILPLQGLKVNLEKTYHAGTAEISLDHNDIYRLNFYNNRQKIYSVDLPIHVSSMQGLRVETVTIPQTIQDQGYDQIEVLPVSGDGFYSMGHLLIIGN